MSEWREYRLEDFAEIYNEIRVPLSKMERSKRQGKYPYYGASGIIDYVDNYLFDGEFVLISEDGENLKSRQTPIAFIAKGQFWVNNHAHIVKGRKDFHNKLLIYYFQNLDLNPFITGAVQPKLNKENLLSIPITLPNCENEQKAIASVLSSLDDKIDLLHRQNKTLEQMAETLFRQWFIEEAEIQSENQLVMGDLIESVSITHKFENDTIIFLNTSDIFRGEVLQHEPSIVRALPGQAKKSIKKDDILFSEIRPANGRYAYINFEADNYVVSTKLMVLRSKSFLNQPFIFFYLTHPTIVQWLQTIAEDRSGTFPQITFDHIKTLIVNVPSEKKLRNAELWCEGTLEKLIHNRTKIRILEKLRDTLLPKLMSGEIRVKH